MRSLRTLLLGALVVALAACGGGPHNSSAAESTGGEPSTASSASEPAAETPVASTDDGEPGATDIDALNDALVPPNSHELSKTELPQGTLIAYESTDSLGDLKSFYVQKLAELNMTVITTNEAANTWAVGFGTDTTNTGFGGTVVVQNAGDVSNVAVTLATGNGG
jgi:hypothetical protein